MDGGRWGGGSAANPFLRSIIVTAFSIQGWQGLPFRARPELGNGQGRDQHLGEDLLDATVRESGVVGGAGLGLSKT
jgi:hypothetical protein